MPTATNSPYADLHAKVEQEEVRPRCAAPDVDPDLFDPRTQMDFDDAVAVCRVCPRIRECKQEARENRETGVWGGAYFDAGRQRKPTFRKIGTRPGINGGITAKAVTPTPEPIPVATPELSALNPQFQPQSSGPLGRLYTQDEFDILMGRQTA